MSRVNIYIRKEDIERWEAIPNKSEWIHLHLQDKQIIVPKSDVQIRASIPASELIELKVPRNVKMCRVHNIPADKCKFMHR